MTDNNYTLILASASPRRIEMLGAAGYSPVVKPASISEKLPFPMKPETAVMYLALSKGMAVAGEITGKSYDYSRDWPPAGKDIKIVAADTVVVHEGRIIGKPENEKQAFEILAALRGTSHNVITGCCVITIEAGASPETASKKCFFEDTRVFFTDYTDEELTAYVNTDEPYDKAGGYAIQETFGKYVDHYEGDYDNVIGLPLSRLKEYL
ncbi:MAG: Maf family protein [Lentihominibacter sp.]